MESQPQNPEFRDNPENFHPCPQNTGFGAEISKINHKCRLAYLHILTYVDLSSPRFYSMMYN